MTFRRAISLLCLIVWVIAQPASASDAKEILVKSGVVTNGVATITLEVDGNTAEFECFLSQSSCKVPRPGSYFVEPSAEAIYEDCSNVNLYEISASGKRGEKVGTYCDLSGPGGPARVDKPQSGAR